MYWCESWTIKKAEHWRIAAFELWCWRRLLRVPWTARRSNQSILKEISPGCSLEGLMLKLETPILGPPDVKNWLIWKDPDERLKVREEGDDRGWDGWTASLAQWTRVWVSSRSWQWTGKPGLLQSMGSQRVRHDWATYLKRNWTVLHRLLQWEARIPRLESSPHLLQLQKSPSTAMKTRRSKKKRKIK